MKRHDSTRTNRGFSLVEVTLAIGITAVALVSLMGMLPRGIKNLQRASDQAVMGRIHQQILGEIQVTPWESKDAGGASPIESFDGLIKYYDDQGIELAKPSTEEDKHRHVYTAKVNLPKPGSQLPKSVGGGTYTGTIVPGQTGGGGDKTDQFMRMVLVEVTSNVDPRFLSDPSSGFDRLEYPGAIFTYRTLVAKMGQQFGSENEN